LERFIFLPRVTILAHEPDDFDYTSLAFWQLIILGVRAMPLIEGSQGKAEPKGANAYQNRHGDGAADMLNIGTH
jgi:hypothetical protein